MLYEVAKGKNFNSPRGILISEDNLFDWVIEHGDESIGMSVFAYDDAQREIMEAEKTSDWFNQAYCPWVPIDVDKGDNSDEHTLKTAASIVYALQDQFGLKEHNLKIYFSGTGYHIMINGECFGFPSGHKDLPYVVKSTMENLMRKIGFWDSVDDKVWMRTSIIRCPFSINPKSNLYKTPITIKELMSLRPEDIFKMAATKRLDFPFEDEYSGDGELEEFLKLEVPILPVYKATPEPVNNYHCIYTLLSEGPVVGTRNNTLLVLASHLRRMGVPSQMAKSILLDWNDNSLDKKVVIEKVEKVYLGKYNYGCSSRVMKSKCSTRCIHYNRQVTAPGAKLSFEEMFENAKKRDFLKELSEGIKIGDMIGFDPPGSFVVIRGEIVTLLGPTKSGKSTLMKNIVLGIDMANPNKLIPDNQLRKTLYYTAEQSSEHFLVMCAQILEGCSKTYAYTNKNALLDKWERRLSNITPVDQMPTLPDMREQILELDPEVVVIDTLDHMAGNSSGSEHEGIKKFMLEVQKICAETGKIFYIVSQISRFDARDGKVMLFSGKGSGSIENQSRKVFGISNTADKSIKRIEIFADTQELPPDDPVHVYMGKTLRFRKTILP